MKIKFWLVAVLIVASMSFGATKVQAVDNSALIAQLKQQIAALQAQIAQLQAQDSGQTWCHNFTGYLFSGSNDASSNGEVSYLRQALSKEGFNTNEESGDFGDITANRIIRFQAKYGILQTGTVGPRTRAKLNALYGCKNSKTSESPVNNLPVPSNPTSASMNKIEPMINSFTINGLSGPVIDIQIGSKVILAWSASNSSYCTGGPISELGGKLDSSGYVAITPTSNIAYTLSCVSLTGNETKKNISVNLLPNPSALTYPSVTFTVNGSQDPIITIANGSRVTLAWSASGANYCTGGPISELGGKLNTSGSVSHSPTSNATYVLTCVNANGNETSKNISVNFSQSTNSSSGEVTGVCMLSGPSGSTPLFSAADVGAGYAKVAKEGYNTLSGLASACANSVYDSLLSSYCAKNPGGTNIQQQIVTYKSSGSYNQLSCGPDMMHCVSRSCQ